MLNFKRQYHSFGLFLISAFYIHQGCSVKLPKTFKRCRVSASTDNKPNECLREAIEDAVAQLTSGADLDLGLTTLDPFNVDRMLIERGKSSPVSIKLEYTDNTFTGASTTKVLSATGKVSSPKDFKLHFDVFQSNVGLYGPYTVTGKVLILPIQGKGMSNMTMTNAKVSVDMTAEPDVRNGKEYLKITNFGIKIQPERLNMNLENLFNGNKALGDNMNSFMNDNWKDIYVELQDSIEKAFGAIYKIFVRRIFEKIQFKSIFSLE